jgi:hypothetical protein
VSSIDLIKKFNQISEDVNIAQPFLERSEKVDFYHEDTQ